MTAELATGCTREQAEAITSRFREAIGRVETAFNVVVTIAIDAYTNRVWEPLGYDSWDDYCAKEVDTAAVRIPRQLRVQIVEQMSEAGMSTRAIAPTIGASKDTVSRDLRSGVSDETPEPEPDDEPLSQAECEQLDRESRPVLGLDGKTYPRREPQEAAPAKPRAPRSDVVALMNRVTLRAEEAAEAANKIERRHMADKKEEAARWERDLRQSIESLQRLADLLEEVQV